jgi:hypothetical protein
MCEPTGIRIGIGRKDDWACDPFFGQAVCGLDYPGVVSFGEDNPSGILFCAGYETGDMVHMQGKEP